MRTPQEKTFTSFDNSALFYRHWPAVTPAARRVIVLLHRGHEHSGRLQHIADELNMPDTALFAWDARGHGRNSGPRGYSPSLGTTVRDLDAFVHYLCQSYGYKMEEVIVIAQSVGAVLASTWVHDYAPQIRALILASPAFKVKLYIPFARPGLRLMEKLRGNFYVNSYVKAKFLTHDPERIASYDTDPLIARPISVNILLGLYDTAERIIADAGAIQTPVQLLISGADFVVHQAPQRTFFERLGSPCKEMHTLEGFYHDTLGEKDRAQAFTLIRSFIQKVDNGVPKADLSHADQSGYTADEFLQLQKGGSPFTLKYWHFALTRLSLATVGKLSDGIRLGWETGFDSGSTLDYVYRNKTSGRTLLGRFGDRTYLDSVGWKGIRQRKTNLEELIGSAIQYLTNNLQPVQIVDIAAGHGRYILDAVSSHSIDHVLLRDYSMVNVAAGKLLIEEKGLTHKAEFQQGDAFDRASLSSLTPRPTLAVVSGLYELFPENIPVKASLAGLADAVPEGGFLVYTNQPWHPQLELIARTLTSHRAGADWIMRRRTQYEMDQLVEQAGFEKITQRIDEWGIFTVSLARRVKTADKETAQV